MRKFYPENGACSMRLDIGCGHRKDEGWIGIDIQHLPGVDIVHDLNLHPWPVESESVEAAKAWHIVEHIPPVAVTEKGTRQTVYGIYG